MRSELNIIVFFLDTTQKGLKDNAMPIVNTDKCGGPKNLTENITPYMMCAGFQKGRHDACQVSIEKC